MPTEREAVIIRSVPRGPPLQVIGSVKEGRKSTVTISTDPSLMSLSDLCWSWTEYRGYIDVYISKRITETCVCSPW